MVVPYSFMYYQYNFRNPWVSFYSQNQVELTIMSSSIFYVCFVKKAFWTQQYIITVFLIGKTSLTSFQFRRITIIYFP